MISRQSADVVKAYRIPRKTGLVFLAVFGLSLFGVSSSSLPLPVTIADATLAVLITYSLLRYRRLTINGISRAAIILAILVTASGAVNALREPAFDTGNFLSNYLRLVGVVVGVLLLPILLRRIGHDTLARASAAVLVVHALLVIAETTSLIPPQWFGNAPQDSGGIIRASGLFSEPSFFGLFVGLSLVYIAQVQLNERRSYLGAIRLGIVLTAVFISTSVGGIAMGVFGAIALYPGMGWKSRAAMAAGLVIAAGTLSLVIPSAPDTTIAKSWNYLAERSERLNPIAFTDRSARVRLVGSWELAFAAIREAPLLGQGIGGASQERTFEKYKESFRVLRKAGSWIMQASVMHGVGILGLISFSFIMLRLVFASRTRWFGVGFALASVTFGGVFDAYVWWNIALASSLLVRGRAPRTLDTGGAVSQARPLPGHYRRGRPDLAEE